jgi:hypothetical protein
MDSRRQRTAGRLGAVRSCRLDQGTGGDEHSDWQRDSTHPGGRRRRWWWPSCLRGHDDLRRQAALSVAAPPGEFGFGNEQYGSPLRTRDRRRRATLLGRSSTVLQPAPLFWQCLVGDAAGVRRLGSVGGSAARTASACEGRELSSGLKVVAEWFPRLNAAWPAAITAGTSLGAIVAAADRRADRCLRRPARPRFPRRGWQAAFIVPALLGLLV